MRRKPILALCTILLVLMLVSPVVIQAQAHHRPWCHPRRRIPPIVSTDWLEDNLGTKNLVILDVRAPPEPSADIDFIPGSINFPEALWYINHPFVSEPPWMELPPTEDLFALIGDAGIKPYSKVVVVGGTSGPLSPVPFAYYSHAGITRVAMTLIYAGVQNVAILDGGYDKWIVEGRTVAENPVTPTPVKYHGPVKKWMFVSTEDVESRIGKAKIVDARDEIVYNGTIFEPWAPILGHIPTAKNLPAPVLWKVTPETGENADYITYLDVHTLREMARDVVGRRGRRCCREIIVYCGVGGYASTVFFVLSEVLGYSNVKVYDGSMQLWQIEGKDVVM